MLANVLREYNINRTLLSCSGLWPFQHKLAKRLLPTFYFTLAVSYLPFEILTLHAHRHNMEMVFDCSSQMIITMCFFVKLVNQLWNRDKFRRLYKIMEKHWDVFTNDLEVRILKHYSSIARKFTISYSVTVYLMASMFIIIPSLGPMFLDSVLPLNQSRPRNIAIYVDYGVDQDRYFIPIFLYTSAMITVGMTVVVAADTMHIACTAHACGLFRLIGRQVEGIMSQSRPRDQRADETGARRRLDEEAAYREYVACLRKHQLALEYVDVLNATHNIVGASFLLLVTASLIMTGVRILYVLDQLGEMIRYMFIIMVALLQLIVLCYSGQKLMDESQNVFHRAYAAEWYNFSPRLKSLLIITLYRSIVPCRLMAGDIFPLSMAVFAEVIRVAVSYFTALLSLRE